MRYYINASGGYINSISTVNLDGNGNASAEEYAEVKAMFDAIPTAPDCYDYRLRADTLEWELHELPKPEPIEEEATAEDYEAALAELGVI